MTIQVIRRDTEETDERSALTGTSDVLYGGITESTKVTNTEISQISTSNRNDVPSPLAVKSLHTCDESSARSRLSRASSYNGTAEASGNMSSRAKKRQSFEESLPFPFMAGGVTESTERAGNMSVSVNPFDESIALPSIAKHQVSWHVKIPRTFDEAMALPFVAGDTAQNPNVRQLVFYAMELPERERLNILHELTDALSGRNQDPFLKVVDCDGETGKEVIRRFQLQQICDEETNRVSFDRLLELLNNGPRPMSQKIEALYYEDSDGDAIAIATTMELTYAVSQLRGKQKALVLYSTPGGNPIFSLLSKTEGNPVFALLGKKICAILCFIAQACCACLAFIFNPCSGCFERFCEWFYYDLSSSQKQCFLMVLAIFVTTVAVGIYHGVALLTAAV